MRVLRIDKASDVVVNAEAWNDKPPDTDQQYFVVSDSGNPGDTYADGATTPPPPPVQTFTPAQIVAAFDVMGLASTILTNTDEVTKARFFTATAIREDAPELLTALQAVGKTIDDFKENIVGS